MNRLRQRRDALGKSIDGVPELARVVRQIENCKTNDPFSLRISMTLIQLHENAIDTIEKHFVFESSIFFRQVAQESR
jgi:hypothetical protein